MLEAAPAPTEQKQAARHAAAALESLCEMLETLALLSRIEAGHQVVPLRICQLSDVLEPVLRETAELAAERGIPLRLQSMQGLVRSNRKLLVMIIRSLLLNAIKFGSGDGIRTCCRKRGSQLVLEVQFKGASLDRGNEKNAFVQLSPSAERPIACELGLGLALLEHLCRHLGHSLHYTKLPREGQLLVMEFPLATASLRDQALRQ
jgi:signal transduction histidine kinase